VSCTGKIIVINWMTLAISRFNLKEFEELCIFDHKSTREGFFEWHRVKLGSPATSFSLKVVSGFKPCSQGSLNR
jgi:hypothetical protein